MDYIIMCRARFLLTQLIYFLFTTLVIVNFHDVLDSRSIWKSIIILSIMIIILLILKTKVVQNIFTKFGIK